MSFRTVAGVLMLTCMTAGLKAAEPETLQAAPPNQWVERPMSGWPGKTEYGNVLRYGFTGAGGSGIVVLDLQEKSGKALVRKLNSATGAWTEEAAGPFDIAFRDIYNAPMQENLHGMQTCHDPDRKVLVGLTSTDLDGRGRIIEFNLEAKSAVGVKPLPSPPVVTAASLCYDPVNKEVVLATGGFSPAGGTDGTWLYDGAARIWRRLETPKDVDDVRLPLEKARDRLITLRWLIWKNLEFRATGREQLLDERAKGQALAQESVELSAAFKNLEASAGANAAKAPRAYHRNSLAEAGKLMGEAGGKLSGLDAKLKTATSEELEGLYRQNILPALDAIEKAVPALAVTPEPRMSARLAYDSKNKVIVCFGGNGQRCAYGDTWVYHCEGRWWERRRPIGHPGPQECRTLTFDARNGVLLMNFGWVYDAGKNDWKQLPVPAPKEAFWQEYDAVTGLLVAFNLDMNKAWTLRLDPAGAQPPVATDTPEVRWTAATGEFVLRDAGGTADLKKWKGEMDLWVKQVPDNTWVAVPTHGTGRPNWGRSWSSIVHDPDRLQIYYRDGGHGSYHGADTDHYDLSTGRWFRSDLRDGPPWPMGTYFGWGRSFSYAPWAVHNYKYGLFRNPLTKRLLRGIGQSGRFEGESGVLLYDPDTGRWARELVPFAGGGMSSLGGLVPGVPDGVISIDNFTRYTTKDGTGFYQTAGGTKQWTNLGYLPRAYNDHNFCWFFDPLRNRVLYYGGPKDKHELFVLDAAAAAPKWQKLAVKGAGDGTLPLSSREVVYVPRDDVFLMIAGSTSGVPLVIWSLDAKTNVFTRLTLAGAKLTDGDVSQGLQYDPGTGLCLYIAASSGPPSMYAFRYAGNASAPPGPAAPAITTPPASQSVQVGQTATFSVAATGTAPLAYQWQKNGANIAGATSASYTTPATTTVDNGASYRVVVTNAAGSATSNSATLTLTAAPPPAATAPSIPTQPANQTAQLGQAATFSVAATGTAPLAYQWQRNGANIVGATSASYTTPATTTVDNGASYRVVVTNAAGSATSNSATLTLTAAPPPAATAPSITTQPSNRTAQLGQAATFSVTAAGTAPLSYQWQKDGVNISGATGASFVTSPAAATDDGATFRVIVTNSAGSVTSAEAKLTVTPFGDMLPAPWEHQDIGAVGIAGGAGSSGGTFTVKGAGADIGGSADAFQFVYQSWSGNGEIIARVATLTNTGAGAKAGVMFRESLAADSANVALVQTPGGALFQWRLTAGGPSSAWTLILSTVPCWIRLVREGTLFTGSVSSDGESWSAVGSQTVPMGAGIYAGLAVTSRDPSASAWATFDRVNVGMGSGMAPPAVPSTGDGHPGGCGFGTATATGEGVGALFLLLGAVLLSFARSSQREPKSA